MFWESIRESTNPGDFEAYLRHLPSGRLSGAGDESLDDVTRVGSRPASGRSLGAGYGGPLAQRSA